MKFVSAAFGQVLHHLQLDEIRPSSGFDYSSAIKSIAARYNFLELPTNINEIIEKGIAFGKGAIRLGQMPVQVTSLGVYNDGILITSLNTDDAELLTDDFVSWATNEFGLRPQTSNQIRTYSSQVIVDFDFSIDVFVYKIDKIISLLKESIYACSHREFDLHVARLAITADPLLVRFPAQSSFYIEPRAGLPFEEHRYISGAPLKTSIHLALLAEIEKLLT
jgi:hypothetical protein